MTKKSLWISIFGKVEWLGLNRGFWASLVAAALIVIAMNLVFGDIKPQK